MREEMGRTMIPEGLGESDAFMLFQEKLSAVAKVDRPVLIVGERGTGKELAVNRLHYLSHRWKGPLVALNCSALSPTVVESELFGHEAGSFTGASRRREGRFEAARGGTLFLDEIGLIPMEVQEKILRVVEYRQFERVGGNVPIQVDARIVGATNVNLAAKAARGEFKQDLLDRLSFEVLFLPPLRDRQEDIMLLARFFGRRMVQELGRGEDCVFSEEAVGCLEAYRWPGNIRELKNVVERAVYRSPGGEVGRGDIVFDPFQFVHSFNPEGSVRREDKDEAEVEGRREAGHEFEGGIAEGFNLTEAVGRFERAAMGQALKEAKYHQASAAKILGISYHQFRSLYRKYKDALER